MFAVLVFFAEVVGSVVGFGSSTLLAPVAFSMIDFRVALVVLAWTHIAGMVTRFIKLHEHVDRHTVIFFGGGSVVGSVIGAIGADKVPVITLQTLLGLSLFVYGLVTVFRPVHLQIRHAGTLLVAGVLSGIISGLVGTGGVVQGAILSATHLKKKIYLATAALISIAVDLARVFVYHQSVGLESISLYFLATVFVMAVLGSLFGVYIAHAIPQKLFKRLIGFALCVVGTGLVWKGVQGL